MDNEWLTVKNLIEYLQTQQQDMLVACCCHSEQCLMKEDDIYVIEACAPRNDGWLQDKRPDKPTQQYLLFPGN